MWSRRLEEATGATAPLVGQTRAADHRDGSGRSLQHAAPRRPKTARASEGEEQDELQDATGTEDSSPWGAAGSSAGPRAAGVSPSSYLCCLRPVIVRSVPLR